MMDNAKNINTYCNTPLSEKSTTEIEILMKMQTLGSLVLVGEG
jgi:hypothetical protein